MEQQKGPGVAGEIRRRLLHYRSIRRFVVNHRLLALRKVLKPIVRLRFWLRTSSGSRFYLGDDPDDDVVIEWIVATKEHVYFPVFREPSAEDFVILDVGAWHGFYAVEALRRYPRARLIAVEPDPRRCMLVRKNLSENRLLERAEVVEAGVGRESGHAILESRRTTLASWTRPVGAGDTRKSRVRLLTSHEILRGRLPTLVKCNAEGAEFTLFPQLFDSGVFPSCVVLQTHREFGNADDLLGRFLRAGYDSAQVESAGGVSWYHCWLTKPYSPR